MAATMNRKSRDRACRDPVCGMIVNSRDYEVDYLQMHFVFCSLQCRQRFLNNPRLYIGRAGHKAPKQEGKSIFKQRHLKLDRPLSSDMSEVVLDTIQSMMGIEDVEIDGNKIRIVYDLLQVTEEQIESEIAREGARLGSELSERLRRAFVHYLEEAEIENLAEPSSSPRH